MYSILYTLLFKGLGSLRNLEIMIFNWNNNRVLQTLMSSNNRPLAVITALQTLGILLSLHASLQTEYQLTAHFTSTKQPLDYYNASTMLDRWHHRVLQHLWWRRAWRLSLHLTNVLCDLNTSNLDSSARNTFFPVLLCQEPVLFPIFFLASLRSVFF